MSFRTDLAVESAEPHGKSLKGVTQEERTVGNLKINRVEITDEGSAQLIGKAIGEYITITVPTFASVIEITEEETEEIARQISTLLPDEGLVLVVGLGNNDITPDAVGPRTVRQVLATRHISGEVARQNGLYHLRATAAIAPGVLGQTGIETSEIIRSIVADINPSAIIVVDALAARCAARLGNTIQISNTGISPGSGVMNARKELSRSTMGVPVISIGIPTVVDATTLASDLLESREQEGDERRALFEPQGQAMMITPREIDVLIGHACKTLSLAINKAIQPDMTLEEIGYMVS